MSERLTDEQLRETAENARGDVARAMATELIRLRAVWKIAQPFLPGPVYVRCLAALEPKS